MTGDNTDLEHLAVKSAPTPGPRTVDRDDGESGLIYYAVHGANYEFIANFDKKADAMLDAAAPDLAAVVRDMLAGLQYLRDQNSIPYGFGIDRLEETGRTAIAKATGA